MPRRPRTLRRSGLPDGVAKATVLSLTGRAALPRSENDGASVMALHDPTASLVKYALARGAMVGCMHRVTEQRTGTLSGSHRDCEHACHAERHHNFETVCKSMRE